MSERDVSPEGGRSVDEIQAEIGRTRSAIHEDIKAIGEKFSAA